MRATRTHEERHTRVLSTIRPRDARSDPNEKVHLDLASNFRFGDDNDARWFFVGVLEVQ